MKTLLFAMFFALSHFAFSQDQDLSSFDSQLKSLSQFIQEFESLDELSFPTEQQAFRLKELRMNIKSKSFALLETIENEDNLHQLVKTCRSFDDAFADFVEKKGTKILNL